MSNIKKKAILRREQDILDRLENVKRLIQMETTLLTAEKAGIWCAYRLSDRENKAHGGLLLSELRDEIQLQLLSIAALCYGDNPDVGDPVPMLEWNGGCVDGEHPADAFHAMWDKCLIWNA